MTASFPQLKSQLLLPINPERRGEGGARTRKILKKTTSGKILFSIITIVFNGKDYLEETIRSVLNQSYDNVEYIIIDGGSEDGTLEVIQSHENSIDYWVSEKDRGVSHAMNKGLSLCRGDYIGLIHSGDSLEPNCLEQVEQNHLGHDVIYGQMNYRENSSDYLVYEANHRQLKRFMSLNHPAVFVKKEIYHKFGVFSESYKLSMDYDLLLRFYLHRSKFFYIPKPLANMSAGGISETSWKKAYKEVYQIKKKSLGNRPSILLMYFFQVIKTFVKNQLLNAGIKLPILWYRKFVSEIKKIEKQRKK